MDVTAGAHNHRFQNTGGVAAEACAEVLRRFFAAMRASSADEEGP